MKDKKETSLMKCILINSQKIILILRSLQQIRFSPLEVYGSILIRWINKEIILIASLAVIPWQAYESISIRVLESAIPDNEILIVLADYITTPRNIRFEVNVKRKINEKLKRLAIAGVCRFNSKSNDLLQVADLIVGAINYDLKLSANIILRGDKYKRRFLEYFKGMIGLKDKNFADGFRSHMFNIFVDKDIKQRLPLIAGSDQK